MIEAMMLIWYVVGAWSHIYWVRNQYDYTTNYLGTTMIAGFLGPLSFWVGWTVYGDSYPGKSRTIWKKR